MTMKFAKRAAALACSAALFAGLLAGCGQSGVPGAAQYQTPDIISQLTDGAVTRDTEFLNVDGESVTAEELLYWAIYDCDYLSAYYYGGAENMAWEDTFTDDQTPGPVYPLRRPVHRQALPPAGDPRRPGRGHPLRGGQGHPAERAGGRSGGRAGRRTGVQGLAQSDRPVLQRLLQAQLHPVPLPELPEHLHRRGDGPVYRG